MSSCGGVVGWEGEGSPFSSADTGITHQVAWRAEMECGVLKCSVPCTAISLLRNKVMCYSSIYKGLQLNAI